MMMNDYEETILFEKLEEPVLEYLTEKWSWICWIKLFACGCERVPLSMSWNDGGEEGYSAGKVNITVIVVEGLETTTLILLSDSLIAFSFPTIDWRIDNSSSAWFIIDQKFLDLKFDRTHTIIIFWTK